MSRKVYLDANGEEYYPDCAWDNPEKDSVNDPVNHPSHYETGKFESIDVMVETQGAEAVKNFCVCNAFKYIYRHRLKNGVEDIKKAIWYLNKYVELEEMDERH